MTHARIAALAAVLAALPAAAQIDPGTTAAAWPPWLAGGLIGVLVMCTFYFSQKPVGASGAYAKVAGLIGKKIAPQHIDSLPFYKSQAPRIDWEVMLVTGAVLGAFLAAWSGGELTGRWLPPMWEEHFGHSVWLRVAVGFIGGAIMAFGARLAGGCTSGHGISGALQLSVGSWVAMICFFIGGATTAALLYRL